MTDCLDCFEASLEVCTSSLQIRDAGVPEKSSFHDFSSQLKIFLIFYL